MKIILLIINSLLVILPLILSIAFLTLAERKVMSSMQRRLGPNTVGLLGLLQPFADALKLVIKEAILPSVSNKGLFIIAPIISLSLSLIGWAVIPLGPYIVISDISLGILFILSISSLSIYGVILSGWAANNKYSLFGSLRSTAQMLSYELVMSMIILNILICSGSYNLSTISTNQDSIWNIIPMFPMGILLFIIILAELQRAPFDLLEAESELIAGFMTEYSSIPFAFFFLAEYGNMILMSSLYSLLFLGGFGQSIGFTLGLKIALLLYLLIWIRASFPRYRYDLLMTLCWKYFLPLSLGFTLFIPGLLIAFDWSN